MIINQTVDDVTLQLGDAKNSLTEIEDKTLDITLGFTKIKEHVSDVQTLLSFPHLISKTFLRHLIVKLHHQQSDLYFRSKSLVTDRGGHLTIFVFCEFLHICVFSQC
jgi:hypothetical protein